MNFEEIIQQLTSERDRIDQAITALRGGNVPKKRGRKPGSLNANSGAPPAPTGAKRRGRPPLTPAQKKRLSEQMKKRWAERKAAQRSK
ncbi:MAG: hypothetical protein NVS9B15_01810 [Acidobacteriaceae bacterium]